MMRTIYLYGHLKDAFGDSFRFNVETAGEALRALNCAFPGKFVEQLREGSYRVIRGQRLSGMDLDIDAVNALRLGGADLHIVPVAEGAKHGGIIKTIIGVVLVGAAIFFSGGTLAAPLAGMGNTIAFGITYGNIALVGLGVALLGVSSILAAQKKPENTTDRTDSFTFSGPVNVNEQGNPIPLIYGEVITGSQPVSVGLDIEEIAV